MCTPAVQGGRKRPSPTRSALVFALILLGALVVSGCAMAASGSASAQHHGAAHDRSGSSASSAPLGARAASVGARRYGIVERQLDFGAVGGADPWDVPVTIALTSPSGRVTRIGGYYDGAGWRFRFAPPQPGRWRWRATLAGANGSVAATRSGTFTTTTTRGPGFVHVSRTNPYLWSFENGSPYYPLGLETCLVDDRQLGSPYHFVLDGGLRPAAGATGSLFGAGGRNVDLATYISTYAHAGFNLFRWSVDNCSFGLYDSIAPSGNVYSATGGRFGDQLVTTLHRNGMHVYMAIFGNNPPGDTHSGTDPSEMAAVERYVRYVVARYGAYVDFWELMNETTRSPAWYQQVTSYLRSIDPYHHPISTSYPPADLSGFDINSPHWYEHESEFSSDTDTFQRFAGWKAAGKPVIVGEQGNSGQNWDPRSGVRMRLRLWATFFSQGSLILWNEVAFKDLINPGAADIWIGPTERHYTSVLSNFTQGFDPLARMANAQMAPHGLVRGYELKGPRMLAVYVTAYTNHSSLTHGATVQISPGFRGTATWISPATGQILGRVNVRGGAQLLRVPAFNTDVVLKAVRVH